MHQIEPRTGSATASPTPLPASGGRAERGAILPGTGMAMLWALCLLPLLLFAVFAAYQRNEALRGGETAVSRTIQILEEHALRVFEAQELIIDQTDQFLGDMSWDEIRASGEVHRFLRRAADASPHVDGLWLVPPDGRTANSADFFPFPDVSVSDRRYFQALSVQDELHFGEMIVGRTKGTFNFNLSRRRSPRDSFNGVILVTSSLDYFTEFWKQASGERFVAGIFREDGEILVRFPFTETPLQSLDEGSPMLERMNASDDAVYRSISSIDGRARIYGYSRIGQTPLFIGYGVANAEVLAYWQSEMLRMGFVALMASVLLVIAAGTITKQSRRLGATAVSWQRTAEALEREVDLRVRAEDVAAERKRLLDEVRALTAERQSILENMAEAVIALDGRGRIIYANREAAKLLGPFREGEQEFASLLAAKRLLAADGADLDPACAPDRAPLRGEDLPETEFMVRSSAGQQAACVFRGGSIFDAEGRPDGAVLTFLDVTERRREAERRDLLMRELDHRVRNMLATIMAMIRISNEPGQTKEAFVAALTGRVAALARTHGVLSDGRWEGATMGRLVNDEVRSASRSRQLVVEGDRDLLLPPKEAADLALALHELATNAIKHGAWSVPEGRVTLGWRRERGAQGEELVLVWKESGGPAIARPPARRGFGTSLLEGIFGSGDGVTIAYAPDGLCCTMRIAMRDRRQEEPPGTEAGQGPSPPQPGDLSLDGLRVLVVEDEAVVRLDLVEMLQEAGATVVAEAGSLSEGFEKAEAAEIDAAVLDRNLNGESSLPLARFLDGRGVAVVFASGYGSTDMPAFGRDHVHLQKPVSPEALVGALAAAPRRATA